MEMIINSSYLITIGTLIGYERKMKCKELAGTKEKEAYKQIPFCEGICCVQTYRNIEKATLEVKTPIYEELLHKLGYEMNYDDALYKEINYRLQNLNDAIEKYDLESVFLIVDKLQYLISKKDKNIYYKYLKIACNVILNYFKLNKLPETDEWFLLDNIYYGFPNYIKDIFVDLLYKYALSNMENDEEYFKYVSDLNLVGNSFVLNKINYLQYLCLKKQFDEFYLLTKPLLESLEKRELYLRIIDIYDLKTYADMETNPTKIMDDLENCNDNITKLLNKLKIRIEDDSSPDISKTIKRKLSQHYYHIGYSLMCIKNYEKASKQIELSLMYDDVFEVICKVMLINCYDRLGISEKDRMNGIYSLVRDYEDSNKHFIVFKYFVFKEKNDNIREYLKYLKKYVLENIFPEDTMLVKIILYELNKLAKKTSNYQILQEFIEKMGIID